MTLKCLKRHNFKISSRHSEAFSGFDTICQYLKFEFNDSSIYSQKEHLIKLPTWYSRFWHIVSIPENRLLRLTIYFTTMPFKAIRAILNNNAILNDQALLNCKVILKTKLFWIARQFWTIIPFLTSRLFRTIRVCYAFVTIHPFNEERENMEIIRIFKAWFYGQRI